MLATRSLRAKTKITTAPSPTRPSPDQIITASFLPSATEIITTTLICSLLTKKILLSKSQGITITAATSTITAAIT